MTAGPRHTSWWERGLATGGEAVAAPGAGSPTGSATTAGPGQRPSGLDHLPRRVDVLIVGAGFMGRWLAHFLTRATGQRGAVPRVLVVERDVFAYGASSRNAGFLTCGHVSEMMADAAHVGESAVVESFLRRLHGMAVVRREFPGLVADPCGSVDHDPLTDEGVDLAQRLNRSAGREVFSVRQVTRVAGRAHRGEDAGSPAATRPGLATEVRTGPALFNAADAGVDPVAILERLRRGSGATFAFGVEVRHLGGGRASLRVDVDDEIEVDYGHAFVCTNAFSRELHPASTVVPGRGQVVVTGPVPGAPARGVLSPSSGPPLGYLNAGYDYFRWLGDRLLVGGGRHRFGPAEDGTTELEPTDQVRAYLLELARSIAGVADVRVEHHWAGVMGFPGGHHLGTSPRTRMDDRTDVVAGFGGMGVALTPAVAEEVALEMVGPP